MLPNKSDSRWRELLIGKKEPAFSSLATKLLVTRLRNDVQRDPAAISAAIDEIHAFFDRNAFAANDLARI